MTRRKAFALALGGMALLAGVAAFVRERRIRDRLLDAVGYAAALPPARGFSYSYYVPGSGTRGSTLGLPPDPVTLAGDPLPFPVYVVSDVGRYLLRLDPDGRVVWALLLSKRCRGVGVAPGEVFYPRGDEVVVLDSRSGRRRGRIPMGDVGHLNFVHFADGRLVVGYSGDGPGRVRVYERSADGRFDLRFTNPHSTQGVRQAGTKGGFLYVADTFGHRCYVVDMATSRILWERPTYFPCSMEPTPDGAWLVAEEHANRVLKVADGGGSAEVILSCPDPLFADPASSPEILRAKESAKVFTTSDGLVMGLASERASGDRTLYSPNGLCRAEDGRLIVADTDNHRLVVVRDGRIVSTLRGFNNPVKVYRVLD